ncbi:MAG: hypothetical protein M1834_004791 [Cirrosporium novae-zelandiae]|nr:MAG: hypothetical protein M1834_004791 [Cirrosporium novae-zelandiae]
MATDRLDPKTFKSCEEAFQYPIPAVRRMEHQLRGDISANKEKLRTLVGASHRELLGTAERIVDMSTTIKEVDTYITSLGRKCNAGVLDKKKENYIAWKDEMPGKDKKSYALASQIAVLNGCTASISHLLRTGGSLLLASKTLVISRLLHKLISQGTDSPPFVDSLRNKLGLLRRKLLAQVDKQMGRSNTSLEVLIEALCAFSLATSSSLTDVVRHFQHVRLESISAQLSRRRDGHANTVRALKLFIRTIHDTHTLLPRRLSDALRKLRSQQLLEDPDVRNIFELNLDLHERWIPNDVKKFVPWIRHDDLQKTQAVNILKQWVQQAFETYTNGLNSNLAEINDVEILANLRKQLIEAWLSSSTQVSGIPASSILNKLRESVNNRLVSLIQEDVSRLCSVGEGISTVFLGLLESPHSSSSLSLWDPTLSSMDFSRGAAAFKKAISDRRHGHDVSIQHTLNTYKVWLSTIEKTHGLIQEMQKIKWDMPLGEELSSDEEDEDSSREKSAERLLNEVDPSLLQSEFRTSLETAFSTLQSLLSTHMKTIITPETPTTASQKPPNSTLIVTIYLLRAIRFLLFSLPTPLTSSSPSPFFAPLIPSLHTSLSTTISTKPLYKFTLSTHKFLNPSKPQVKDGEIPAFATLWEGETTPLPVLPCPFTYRFLRDVVYGMSDAGADVWNPAAALALKKILRKGVCEAIGKNLDQEDKNNENNDENQNNNKERERERLVQLLFDITYLQHALSISKNSNSNDAIPPPNEETQIKKEENENENEEDALPTTASTISKKANLAPTEEKKLRRNAEDYWRRTALLFALLDC